MLRTVLQKYQAKRLIKAIPCRNRAASHSCAGKCSFHLRKLDLQLVSQTSQGTHCDSELKMQCSMVVMITPVAFANIGYQTYIIFAVINAFIVPCVYFFYPEVRRLRSSSLDTTADPESRPHTDH